MWGAAVETEALKAAIAGATEYRQVMLRLYGIPESEIAETLRVAEREGVELGRLEVTTCLKRGEVEVVTSYEPAEQGVYDAFEAVVRERHADTLFSDDGSTVDDQVAELLRGKAADGRHGRVLHRRPAGGQADGESGRVGLREGRDRRLLQRREDRPGGRAGRADRADTARSRPRSPRRSPQGRGQSWAPMSAWA